MAFGSLKVLIPSLTEKQFATIKIDNIDNNDENFNINLVYYTNFLDKNDTPIEKIEAKEKSTLEKVGVEYYNMSFEVISVDITSNTKLMEKILIIADTFAYF